ncbi:MAG: PVC-type heme-binding CxxCH protein [Pirellulales bacterium]
MQTPRLKVPIKHCVSVAICLYLCSSVFPGSSVFPAAGQEQPDSTRSSPRPLSSQSQSPDEAQKSFELPSGYRIELMAAEPLVQDPVAIEWGADGKLWVAEMADYPYGLDGKMSPGGRVRYLEDTDGDGKPDRSTVFLDKINFPTGVLPWRNGVLITAAPEIFYAEDTNGDGKADRRETLFTGFKEGNPQLRVNGLQWGLDGWVYCANGWSGGEARSAKTGKVVDLKRLDFRIQPDTGELELLSGITEFGRNRDDWGNWFGCDNTHVAWHFVLEDRYLRRNPHFTAPDPRKQFLPPAPRVFARSRLQKRYHTFEHADRYTSACAATPYRDDLLFNDGAQHLFVCEPVHNLVQHLALSEQGTSFTAVVPEHREQRDFLTSTDPWFRPVNLRTGPDGALWVVDMYRYMIEHPDWLPDEGQRELEPHYRAGENRGRIYRVYHQDSPPRRWQPLATANTEQLCAALESPNGWRRDIAQQQLLWRGKNESPAAVADVFDSATSAKARLQALYALSTLTALDERALLQGLRDSHPMVRRAAVRLAEERINNEAILTRLLDRAADDHPSARLQLACTLGESTQPDAAGALARILLTAGDDHYLTAAVFSSLRPDNLEPSFSAALKQAKDTRPATNRIVELVALAAALGRDDLIAQMFADIEPSQTGYLPWQVRAADEWLRGVKRRKSAEALDAVQSRTGAAKRFNQPAQERLADLLNWSRERSADPAADTDLRVACLKISLRNASSADAATELARTALNAQTPHDIQRIAVQELAAFNTANIAAVLLDRWQSFGPSIRQEVISAVLSQPKLSEELLTRLEQGDIRPAEIDAASRQRFLTNRSDSLRRRARLIFGESASDRQQVLRESQDIGNLAADAVRGREVFLQKCASCHATEGRGYAVGPDLAALSDRSTPGLLAAILDPSRAIEPKYALYQAITRDGRSYTGILAAETSGQIELVEQENRRHVIPRSELEELSSSAKSLMPDGFEKELSRQQLADLIGYLQKPLAAERPVRINH